MTDLSHQHPESRTIPSKKLVRLLEYMQIMGLDPRKVAEQAGVDPEELFETISSQKAPCLYYSLLYTETVAELERSGKQVPWAAGLGGGFYKMMCYSMISCETLGQALLRAEQYNKLTYPLAGQQLTLGTISKKVAILHYDVDEGSVERSISPTDWSLQNSVSVARSSGIEMWLGLCGWLVGRKIAPLKVEIAGSMPNESYQARVNELFQCSTEFEAEVSALYIPADLLEYRIVHDLASLEEFLSTGPYQLWSSDDTLVSTTAAIKSILGNDFTDGLPSFESMANNLHTSESTLRRHLSAENTSYQKIKDEQRRDLAIDLLCRTNTKISEVSYQVGFSDTSSFVRSFRVWTGVTPRTYRDQASQERSI